VKRSRPEVVTEEIEILLSERAARTGEPPINYMMEKALGNPDLISLAAGFVDYATLPVKEVSQVVTEILSDPEAGRAALQYGTTQGLESLRKKVLKRLIDADGVGRGAAGYDTAHTLVTTGSQQLLYLLSEVLLDAGDIAILEHPSYWVFMGALRTSGVRCVTVPLDEQGMRADLLEEKLAALERSGDLPRLKLIYTMSYYQNPTGTLISDERRSELMKVMKAYSRKAPFYVIEDAAYRELRYHGKDIASLKSRDADGKMVCYLGTFSKPFSPGLKTGYGLLPESLVGPVLRFKGNHDFGSTNFAQHVIDRVMGTALFENHVQELCDAYRVKCDATVKALEKYMPAGVQIMHPLGGLYVWLTLPEGVETGPDSALFEAALQSGVLYVPGEFFYPVEGDIPAERNQMRLSFGVGSPERIREGIQRLSGAVRQVCGQ